MAQQDIPIKELVSKIERGEIRLPEMQREYVWQSTRVRDLLDSLYRGYPSGTILTWETDEGVTTREFAINQAAPASGRFQLLLDGQQRLTSLSAVLRGQPVSVRGRKRPIDILFNLDHPDELQFITEFNENDDTDGTEDSADASEDELLQRLEKMAFVVYSKKIAAKPHWVSVTAVFKENSDPPFLKAAGVSSMDDPRYDKYTSRLKQLRAIRDYGYRVHVLERDKSYEEVTEIFVRVNSLGAKLRSSDLALAQITAKWRDSLKIFQAFEEGCGKEGFPLDLSIHLKNLVAFATGQSRFRAVSTLTLEELKRGWVAAKEGMQFALNFLRSNTGIDSPALLSSPFLIIALAMYGHKRDYHLTPEEAAHLRYWIVTANAKARYSRGSSETFLDQDLAIIRRGGDLRALIQLLQTQVGRLEILPTDLENRNSRSAYFKTMFMAFREDGATDWRDQLKISLKHSGANHTLQFHHLFPQAVLKKTGIDQQRINDICNLSFISGRTNRKISDKEPSIYLPGIVDTLGEIALTRQGIPSNNSLWSIAQYDAFLAARRQLVSDRLNQFLGEAPQ
jgi:hypothetical protein